MKKYKAEEGGHYGAKMTVMQPTVENVSSENVARKGLSSKIEFTPITEKSFIGNRQFLLDDEMAHFVPTKRDEEGMLCSNENYHNCDDYNTEFCRKRCEFAPKSVDDDIILPDIEPDK